MKEPRKFSKKHIPLLVLCAVVVFLNIAVISLFVPDMDGLFTAGSSKEAIVENTQSDIELSTEAATSEKDELLKYIGGYMMRMISGVGELRSGGKPYEVKAYLNDFDYDGETGVQVYYDCGYARLSNKLTWDVSFDENNNLHVENTNIASTGSKCERWNGDFDHPLPEGTDFQPILSLDGTMEERLISADSLFTVDWGRMLHAAWMLWLEGNDTVEGRIKGEIYLSEILGEHSNRPTYNVWVCLDGEKPVKVSVQDQTINELAKTVNIVDGALLSEKYKNTALAKVTFEFTIERFFLLRD